MKRLSAFLLAVLLVLSLSGCVYYKSDVENLGTLPDGVIVQDYSVFEEMYESITPSLLDALKSGDADAVLEMFAPSVREKLPRLKGDIEGMISTYGGTFDEHGENSLSSSPVLIGNIETDPESGETVAVSLDQSLNYISYIHSCTVQIRCGEEHYWLRINASYLDEENKKDAKISKISLYGIAEYYKENSPNSTVISALSDGVFVLANEEPEEPLMVICGTPIKHMPLSTISSVRDVNNYLATTNGTFDAFENKFGEGVSLLGENAISSSTPYAYEVPTEDGNNLYLLVWVKLQMIEDVYVGNSVNIINRIYSTNPESSVTVVYQPES